MNDERELIEAFVGGARKGRSAHLYLEGDVLYLNGWWQVAFRVDGDVFIVRAEPPPEPVDVVERVSDALRGRGLKQIPGEHPLIHAVTYAELSLTGVDWTLWAVHAERAEAALAYRAVPEETPSDWVPGAMDDPALGDLSKEFAKSLVGGMPVSVVLAVGLDDERVAGLRAVLPDCRVEPRALDEAISACGRLVPHLVIVDASTPNGRRFLLEFRAEACGRHLPVAALATGEVPVGADVCLDPRLPPSGWHEQLLQLLP